MRRFLWGAAALAAVALTPGTASATTFSGDCPDIAGTAKFGKPLNNTQADNTYDFTGKATCSGKVNGKDVKDVPVDIHVAGPGNLSCAHGDSTGDGLGTITAKDGSGIVIPFKMTFSAIASKVTIKITGIKSGSGSGNASFLDESNYANNFTTVENCGGDGNKELSFTADATVDDATPLDDGKSESAGSSSSDSSSQSGSSSSGSGDSQAPTSGSSQTQSTANQPASKPKPKKKSKKKSSCGKSKPKNHGKKHAKSNCGKHKGKAKGKKD